MNVWKQLLVYVLSVSLGFAPTVSYAAAPEKQNVVDQTTMVKDFYKSTGYKKDADIGAWLDKNSDKMHFKMKTMIQRIHLAHPEYKLPSMEFSDYQSDGKTYTRITFKSGKDQQIIDVYKNNDKFLAKINGQTISYDDLYYDGILEREDINPMLTLEQLQKAYSTNPQAAANYHAEFRAFIGELTAFSAQDEPAEAKEFSYVDFILGVAYAATPGQACVIAGHLSTISGKPGHVGKCGGDNPSQYYCNGNISGGYRCNGLAYGYQDNGKEFCVPYKSDKPATYVSEQCEGPFPLKSSEDKQKFVENINKYFKLGSGPYNSFYATLESHIKSAGKDCGVEVQKVTNMILAKKTPDFKDTDFLKAFPVKNGGKPSFDTNAGHRTACTILMNRLVYANQAAAVAVAPPVAVNPPAEKTKDIKVDNCPKVADTNKPPTDCKKDQEPAATAVATLPAKPLPPKNESNNPCKETTGLIVCGLLALGAACVFGAFGMCQSAKAAPAEMPVGKPGEGENTSGSTRPRKPTPAAAKAASKRAATQKAATGAK